MKIKLRLVILILFFSFKNYYSQNTYVFFGSFNWHKTNEGIYVYQLDMETGKLSKVTSAKGILNPSYLTLSSNGKNVFACTESKTANAGSVSSFVFDPEKKSLTSINSQKSGGENPVYVSVHKNGKWLINGNYTESSLSAYPISENGFIQPMVQNFKFTEGSINPERQTGSHIHAAVFSPNFDYVFAPDLGADKIWVYTFHTDKKEPLAVADIPFVKTKLGSGPRHFTFHPNGNFAYGIEELSGTVSVYAYKNGELNTIQRINTHPDQLTDGFESSDLHISPDGQFLYASNRGKENNLALFKIQKDGSLQTLGYQSTNGKHPRTFALDETGNFLVVANTVSGKVTVFKRDQNTGFLKKAGKKVKIKGVSSVQIKSY